MRSQNDNRGKVIGSRAKDDDDWKAEAVVLLIFPEFPILTKKDTTFTLRENLKCELEHIAKGEE